MNFNRIIIGILFLSFGLSACKKEDKVSNSKFDFVLSTGSWWAYEWVDYYENGTSQASGIPNDTMRIVGQVEMDNYTWAIVKATNETIDWYMRSENGQLILYPNNITFNSNNKADTLISYNFPGLEIDAITATSMEEISVPAGTFNCISTDIHFNITDRDSANINPCTDFWIGQNTYASGIGTITYKIPLDDTDSTKPCGYKQQQLVDFYVAP